jgi:multiple sugar transport system substrate-binding protein
LHKFILFCSCLSYALLILLLPGCSSESKPAVVIELWAMGREGEVIGALIPEFEHRHPGIQVRVQQIPWSAAHEKLLTAYAGETLPDLFQLGNTWIPEFVALRAIEGLDPQATGSSTVVAEDYFPGILETNIIDGHLYGVPWYVDTRLLFYRQDILAQASYSLPHTWEAWIEAMQRIKHQLGADHYAILLPLNEWQTPVILALQRGAALLREGDQYGNFESPPFREAFAFYLDLFRRGLALAVGETQIANLYQDFAKAHFAMIITGPWNIGEFERRLPAPLEGKWATAPLPGPKGAYPGVSLAGGASLAISRASRHKDAAWKLIEYLSEPRIQGEFYRLSGDLPSRRAAWQAAGLVDHPHAQAFWSQLQHLRSTPKIPEWERIANQIARYSEEVIRGRMTMNEALVALDRTVDRLLEKRRWLLQRALCGF